MAADPIARLATANVASILNGMYAQLLSTTGSPFAAATSSALSGTVSDTAPHILGPFVPQVARPAWLTISGAGASGQAALLRSVDGGQTRHILTRDGDPWGVWNFTVLSDVLVNEQVVTPTEAIETYYLAVTLTAGTINWRLAQ